MRAWIRKSLFFLVVLGSFTSHADLKRDEVAGWIEILKTSKNATSRATAATQLGFLGDTSDRVVQALTLCHNQEQDANVLGACLSSMGRLKLQTAEIEKILIQHVNTHQAVVVRSAALTALGLLGSQALEVQECLKNVFFKDTDENLRLTAFSSLVDLRPGDLEILALAFQAVKDPKGSVNFKYRMAFMLSRFNKILKEVSLGMADWIAQEKDINVLTYIFSALWNIPYADRDVWRAYASLYDTPVIETNAQIRIYLLTSLIRFQPQLDEDGIKESVEFLYSLLFSEMHSECRLTIFLGLLPFGKYQPELKKHIPRMLQALPAPSYWQHVPTWSKFVSLTQLMSYGDQFKNPGYVIYLDSLLVHFNQPGVPQTIKDAASAAYFVTYYARRISQMEFAIPMLKQIYLNQYDQRGFVLDAYLASVPMHEENGIVHLNAIRQLALDLLAKEPQRYLSTRQKIHQFPTPLELKETEDLKAILLKEGKPAETIALFDKMIAWLKQLFSTQYDFKTASNFLPSDAKEILAPYFEKENSTLETQAQTLNALEKLMGSHTNGESEEWKQQYAIAVGKAKAFLLLDFRRRFWNQSFLDLSRTQAISMVKSLIPVSSGVHLLFPAEQRALIKGIAEMEALPEGSDWKSPLIRLLTKAIRWQTRHLDEDFSRATSTWKKEIEEMPSAQNKVFEFYSQLVRTSPITEWDKLLLEIQK